MVGVHWLVNMVGKLCPLKFCTFGAFAIAVRSAIAIGIFFRIICLGRREFWYDEVLSLLLSNGQKIAYQTPGDLPVKLADYSALLSLPRTSGVSDFLTNLVNLLKGIAGGEPHPPLFYLSQHFWLYLFGNSEAGMRSLGVVLSIAAIAAAYFLGKLLLGHRGGLLLAALLAINPFYLFHSLNLRMYGPLVLWVTLTTLSLLQLIRLEINAPEINAPEINSPEINSPEINSPEINSPEINALEINSSKLLWTLLLIGSVTAGCLTFYLFAYWMITLGVVVLFLDRQHWWQHGLRLIAGVLLTIPWALWGTLQQLRNADFGRFNASNGFFASMLQHLQDLASTLGIHLLIGDWATSLPNSMQAIAGFLVMGLLTAGIIYGWQNPHKPGFLKKPGFSESFIKSPRRLLILGFLLSLFPLLIALAVDIITGKFTLGFGWGRSMIFILPGCLLLLTILIMQLIRVSNKISASTPESPQPRPLNPRWPQIFAVILLLLYLGINVGDFTLRPRWMFHQIADILQGEPNSPTLIAMNSKAWGHVMRLAYYIPANLPVMLLAEPAPELAISLEKSLEKSQEKTSSQYQRIIWIDSHTPIWSNPTTETEKEAITKVLESQFQLEKTWQVSGTMNSDEFTLKLYHLSAQLIINN